MTQITVHDALHEHRLVKGASRAAVSALAERAVLRSVDAGQLLCGQSQRTGQVWFLAEGLLHVTIQSANGSPVTVDVLRPGEAFGYLNCWADGGHVEDVSGLLRAQVVGVPAGRFIEFIENNEDAAQALLEETAQRFHSLVRLRAICTEPSGQRVRSVLDFLHDKLGRRIPMTRSMIAMVAGLTTETVSRAMAPLNRQGIIALSRGAVEILKREEL